MIVSGFQYVLSAFCLQEKKQTLYPNVNHTVCLVGTNDISCLDTD